MLNLKNYSFRYFMQENKISKLSEFLIRLFSSLILDKGIRNSVRSVLLALGIKNTILRILGLKNNNKNNFKYYLSIIAMLKDEAPYIKEWIEYYILQGVEHFYIFDNESSDNIQEILQPYIDKNIVTFVKQPGKNMQYTIYNNALEDYKNESKWLAPVDIDEFIYSNDYDRISDYLKNNEKYKQISIKWYIYGDSGHEKKPDGLVIENFNMREKNPCGIVKSIVQGAYTILLLVHNHSVLGLTKYAPIEEIRCNHYYNKSKEEFINKKMQRGSTNTTIVYDLEQFEKHNKNDIYDPMPQKIISKVKEQL